MQIIEWKLENSKSVLDDNVLEPNNFLDNLLTLHNKNKISEKQVIDEFQTMMIAASETVTVTSSAVFTILGIYEEHQVCIAFKYCQNIFFLFCSIKYLKSLTLFMKKAIESSLWMI